MSEFFLGFAAGMVALFLAIVGIVQYGLWYEKRHPIESGDPLLQEQEARDRAQLGDGF